MRKPGQENGSSAGGSPVSKAWPFFLVENPPHFLQVLWQVPKVVSRDAGMGEEEASDGFLEMVVSSHLLGQFPWKTCPRFAGFLGILVWVRLLRRIPAVLSWSLLLVLVLGSAELRRLISTV